MIFVVPTKVRRILVSKIIFENVVNEKDLKFCVDSSRGCARWPNFPKPPNERETETENPFLRTNGITHTHTHPCLRLGLLEGNATRRDDFRSEDGTDRRYDDVRRFKIYGLDEYLYMYSILSHSIPTDQFVDTYSALSDLAARRSRLDLHLSINSRPLSTRSSSAT